MPRRLRPSSPDVLRSPFPGLLLLGLILAGCPAPTPEPADLLLVNARVYTFSWGEPATDGTPAADAPVVGGRWHPDASAVAVRGDRIVFVGSDEDAAALRGDATRVIDLEGATLLPGLVDSHTHVAGLGAKLEQVDVMGIDTEEQAVELVAQRAAELEAGTWIVGWGWDEGAWADRYPTKALLSERVPEHPVVMQSLHGFAVWGNQAALDAAGIDRDTVAPSGGEIRKGADGEPTGLLLNTATGLLTDAVPEPTPDELAERVRRGLQAMAEAGYVAVHEAGVDADLLAAFEHLEAAGELPIRAWIMLSARDEGLCREWLERGPKTDGKLVVRSVKAYYDGALGSRGARLLADYSDQPGHRGVAGDEYGFDQELVAEMIRGGFQAAIHAIGDAGNRETLDFFTEVFEDFPAGRAGRHRIEHAQVLHRDDIPRFAELDLIASMEPPHAVEDKAWAEDRLGPQRVVGAYAWRTLRQKGAWLVFNSDLPGSDHSPFYGLHAAITRRGKDLQPPDGWYPNQLMTPEEAVRGYTTWAAFAAFVDGETGVIAAGRWADLSAINLDPMTVGTGSPASLLNGKVVLTVVGGEVAHFQSR